MRLSPALALVLAPLACGHAGVSSVPNSLFGRDDRVDVPARGIGCHVECSR